MFTVADRQHILDELIEAAHKGDSVIAAAIGGSVAAGRQDEWSDIDLAMRLGDGADLDSVARSWTRLLCDSHDVVDHLDMWSGPTFYRVFLLSNTLQIDLSWGPSECFTATAESFRLVFGAANPPRGPVLSEAASLVGMGWLYALHVRSSLVRGRWWQAVYMLNGLRERVISLACLRQGWSHTRAEVWTSSRPSCS